MKIKDFGWCVPHNPSVKQQRWLHRTHPTRAIALLPAPCSLLPKNQKFVPHKS
ncbi:hypothetical protein [Moorena sp. SIO4G3]|uniref:hypothetical protein n=1 Tax=Moorena sp. SIO4G3 TaxID=2607821 RepID=UPI00142D1906|nr:hypothetical protein [Moorena sp. SIO4G3]NEO78985.1 hypothetical protein [Moorena sp. SIO4G3]